MPIRLLASLMLRTESGPLRRLWRATHDLVTRLVAARLGGSAYVRGSFASPNAREAVYGLSDVDLIVVAADEAGREAALRRWRRLRRAAPMVALKAYSAGELADAATANVLDAPRAIFAGGHPLNRSYTLRTRPGLYGPASDWRHLRGPDRRPTGAPGPAPPVAAWLELQCWWRYAAYACLHPGERHVPYLCFKLVADAARVWLWLVHGERAAGRLDALERGLRRMPQDEAVLRRALALRRSLPRSPDAPVAEAIAWLVEVSSRLAAEVCRPLEWIDVALRRDRGGALPHADWRGVVLEGAGATFRVRDLAGPPHAAVAAAAAAEAGGVRTALRAPGLLLFPSADLEGRPMTRGTLRTVQCAASDPVSFALVEGRDSARFPTLAGWSAEDWARRAVAEQRAAGGPGLARAERFAASLARGEPELELP